ncbi:hypothetical protein [Leucobacter soli]|uniref:hypothetical protein n=1 Tax=Leucobacter soli TaxID=2812850 RepID=UPI00360DF18D
MPDVAKPKLTLTRLLEMKAAGEPIVMVTAYDFPGPALRSVPGWMRSWSATPPPRSCSGTSRPRRSPSTSC